MSLTEQARGYAEAAVSQGRTALAQASSQGRTALAQASSQGRTALAQASSQGRTALAQASSRLSSVNHRLAAEAPKPALAALGAADALATGLARRLAVLPSGGAAKTQQSGQQLLSRAQADALARLAELREQLEQRLPDASTLPASVRTAGEQRLGAVKAALEAYLAGIRDTYQGLTERGAARAGELAEDPRVLKLTEELQQARQRVASLADDPRLAGLRNDPRVARLVAGLNSAAADLRQAAVDARAGAAPLARSAFDAVAAGPDSDTGAGAEPADGASKTAEPAGGKSKPAKAAATRRRSTAAQASPRAAAKAAGKRSGTSAKSAGGRAPAGQ